MKSAIIGIAAIAALALTGPAFAQDEREPDGFQQDDMPGSEIELDVGEGGLDAHRQDGKPLFGDDMRVTEEEQDLAPLDDPDSPEDPDPTDDELPGEGPESLSGPDDEDPLPY